MLLGKLTSAVVKTNIESQHLETQAFISPKGHYSALKFVKF